jgi:hypothetical protein
VTTELLGLGAAGVGDEEGTVVGDEGLLELKSRGGVLVLGVEGNNTLGDSLTEGVELRDVTTTLDTKADVDVGELVGTDNKDGLVDLVAEGGAGGSVLVFTAAFFRAAGTSGPTVTMGRCRLDICERWMARAHTCPRSSTPSGPASHPSHVSQFRLVPALLAHSRLNERDGRAVEADEAAAGGDVSHSGGSLLLAEGLDGRHFL